MEMHYVLDLHKYSRSKNNIYLFSYDNKTNNSMLTKLVLVLNSVKTSDFFSVLMKKIPNQMVSELCGMDNCYIYTWYT